MNKIPEKACRHIFTRTLTELAQSDAALYAITSDAKGSVTLKDFEAAFPDRFVEIGIAEQNAVGIGAGIALSGRKAFVCGPACFYSSRAVEQIKNDAAYAGANVKIIGVSGGVGYGALGSTHHSLHDIALFRAVPGIAVILPCDNVQTEAITRFLAGYEGPVYVRFGRNPVPAVYYEQPYRPGETRNTNPSAPAARQQGIFQFGKANRLREGTDCTLIGTGETVAHCADAAEKLLSEGIEARVLDMHTVKPIDRQAIIDAGRETGTIVTVEEHSINGGLGGAVAEITAAESPARVVRLGFPDEFAPAGSSKELFEYYGLTGEKIAEKVLSIVAGKESVHEK